MKKELSDLDKQTIRELISTTAICDICDINEKTSFTKGLFLDSLDKVEVFMVVESSFNIHISDIDIEECQTVGELFNLVAEKLPNT